MKFRNLSKVKYEEVIKYAKDLMKLNVNFDFENNNIFYLKDEKKEMCLIFVNNYGNECYGLSVYSGINGLNCIHDMLNIKNENSFSIANDNSISLVICKKNDLKDDEIEYFRKNNIRIKKENNYIIRSNKIGFISTIANTFEANILMDAIIYLTVLLKNDLEKIKEGFNNKKQCLAYFSNKKMEYQTIISDLPYLERKHQMKAENEEYILELKDCPHTEEKAYFIIKYVQLPLQDDYDIVPYLPIMAAYSNNLRKVIGFYSIALQNGEYNESLFEVLSQMFKENGIPKELIINNRKFYYEMKKTLEKLGIVVFLQVEIPLFDNFMTTVNQMITLFMGSMLKSQNLDYLDSLSYNSLFGNNNLANSEEFQSQIFESDEFDDVEKEEVFIS